MGIPAVNHQNIDPTFYEYWMSQYGQQTPSTVTQATTPQGAITGAQVGAAEAKANLQPLAKDTVTFKGKEEKSNGAAWGIIGTVATIGAALLCKKAYKIGNLKFGTTAGNTFLEKVKQAPTKIYDGIKQYINKGCKKIGSWNFKNVKTPEQLSEAKFYEKGWNKVKGWWNSGTKWIGEKHMAVNPVALLG
ncbi:MAG: hypothetical protein E7Z92_01315 [Cyanobacteria bacterium SIG31]|nr:hypothetical protein [Cyanobacteria bacterium SIG31]